MYRNRFQPSSEPKLRPAQTSSETSLSLKDRSLSLYEAEPLSVPEASLSLRLPRFPWKMEVVGAGVRMRGLNAHDGR